MKKSLTIKHKFRTTDMQPNRFGFLMLGCKIRTIGVTRTHIRTFDLWPFIPFFLIFCAGISPFSFSILSYLIFYIVLSHVLPCPFSFSILFFLIFYLVLPHFLSFLNFTFVFQFHHDHGKFSSKYVNIFRSY